MPSSEYIINFKRNVTDKYTIYNSLFSALPFSGIANVGALLPILLQACLEGYADAKTPMQIVDHFFSQHTNAKDEADKVARLFKFVQYIERQIVLFDAIEDAAFETVNNVEGAGSLKSLISETNFAGKSQILKSKLKKFKVRVVLTAHPTQFYPGSVLGIIHDMNEAIGKNDFHTINAYIQQLGITPFFNKKQPTPLDEAVNLMWYLENILYPSIGNIYNFINREVFDSAYDGENPFIELGFWPGGDRDGNPFVNGPTTLKVADALRSAIVVCYYRDIRKLKRRLTFTGVDTIIAQLEQQLYENVFRPEASKRIKKEELIKELYSARELLINHHHSLYLNRLDSLIHKVKIFGTHFASLDIRQDSRIHTSVILQIDKELKEKGKPSILPGNYTALTSAEKIEALSIIDTIVDPTEIADTISRDTLESMYAIKTIQKENGEEGCHRYVISNCQGVVNIMEVYALLRLCGWKRESMQIDIVPLFETIDDLDQAETTMDQLYNIAEYKKHLELRHQHQTIMLGFSDGTKDGGYLQANWSIYTAKENLTAISRKYHIKAKFFDGRGGPPSRGGGKTHKFYSSMGTNIENEEIQLTIQGQTITSNFGTIQSSQYNLEQLLSAGLSNELFADSRIQISQHDRFLMEELGKISHASYQGFKTHPLFLAYMQQYSPLNYYSKSNIASRPAKRGNSGGLRFEDLRAIPFVGSWSQLKQNVPGFFGVGTALQQMKERGLWNDTKAMFRNVLFFRTLIDNSMMSMLKSFFPLTEYVKKDPQFGPVWEIIKAEYDLTSQLVLELADANTLMEDDKTGKASIQMRDKIVLPLLTIQQYALNKLHNEEVDPALKPIYEKLVTRTMFGVINAARNSA
ncbi:MAG: phosphoenolpyruvate carboxylase [Bacteroidota bacterium]